MKKKKNKQQKQKQTTNTKQKQNKKQKMNGTLGTWLVTILATFLFIKNFSQKLRLG